MSTLKEQLEAEAAESRKPVEPRYVQGLSTPLFGNPYRAEYVKSAEVLHEKLLKRGKAARPSKKKAMR